jgi:hypothetical protein
MVARETGGRSQFRVTCGIALEPETLVPAYGVDKLSDFTVSHPFDAWTLKLSG